MTTPALTAVSDLGRDASVETRLRAALRPDFLAEAGWDPQAQVLSPPRDHLLLGLRKCAVVDCLAGVRSPQVLLCQTCEARFRAAGSDDLDGFCQMVSSKRNKGEQFCKVPGCPRPTHVVPGICSTHRSAWLKWPGLTAEEWITAARPSPLPSFGACRVVSCVRQAADRNRLCVPHRTRWGLHRRRHPEADLQRWAEVADPINIDHLVIMRGLPERVQLEILVALQRRTDEQIRTFVTVVRALVALARRHQIVTLDDLLEVRIDRSRHDVSSLLRGMTTAVRRTLTSPEEEQRRDLWDLAVFGLVGNLDFTQLSQPWMRAAAKHWAAEDLPLHRGRQASATARAMLTALSHLSHSLRLSRDDQGDSLAELGRRDVLAFTTRLAHQERIEQMSPNSRRTTCRHVRRFLDDVRAFGLTQPGQPLAGLAADFVLRHSDIPGEPREEPTGRDLPAVVLRTVADRLALFEARSGISARRITELLIDTGRRPDEICLLPLDCLDRDASGKAVLIFTDYKNNRPGRRLPIADNTAQVIIAQQDHIREQFPNTAMGELALFPRDRLNPHGTKRFMVTTFSSSHREFVNAIDDSLLDADGRPFNPALVVPYAYRHSYAQRHAGSGVPPDVLRDLMGHRSMQTTLAYYRVSETRVRTAVNRVAQHQFDGRGRRVFHGVAQLLGDEHARMRVGQVAVPFGVCTEPSNVKAGDKSCPYRFTCLGCGHFRSDPSYLPELKGYLQQMLADREHVLASRDLEEWARAKALPADEEISQLRDLIRKIEADLDDLSDADRDQIQAAVATMRKVRQSVNLGMPGIRAATREDS